MRFLGLILPCLLLGAPSAVAAGAPPAGDAGALLAASRAAFDVRRYVQADSLAVIARDLLDGRADADPIEQASVLVALSRARAARRALADSVAAQSARRALALLPRGDVAADPVRADAHDVLALILDEQNRCDLALAHAHGALSLRRSVFGDRHEEVAESWYRLGSAQLCLGLADSALATFRTGLAVRRDLGLERDRRVGDFHCEIAQILDGRGDVDAARDELHAALREYAARLGARHAAMTMGLQRLCTLEYNNGDIAGAADLAQQAVALAESLPGYNPVNLALLRANLAVALSAIGDHERARQALARVLPVYEAHLGEDHRETLWARTALGTAESALGDTASAAARFRDVCRRFESAGTLTSTGALTQARAGLATIAAARDPREALALARAAESAERSRPDLSWKSVAELQAMQLRLHAELGDGAAVARLDTALARTLDSHALRGTAAESQAQAERALALVRVGRGTEAVAAARAGAALARELVLRDVRALPQREALALAGTRSAPLDALLVLAADGRAAPADAWDELVRWRGLVGAEVARRRPPAAGAGAGGAPDAHDAWLAATRRLAREEVRTAGDASPAARDRLAGLRAAATDAERRWAALAPRERGQAVAPGLAEIRRALPAGAALVSLASVRPRGRDGRLVAFVLGAQGTVQLLDLGTEAALEAALAGWRELAGKAPVAGLAAADSLRARGDRLRALTWDRLLAAAGPARRVYVVGEAPLHRLPWGALPAGAGRFVVEEGPEVRVLEAERDLLQGAPAAGTAGLLAVGGVDFGAADGAREEAPAPFAIASSRAILPDCRAGEPAVFLPLPGTGREVEAIARVHERDVRLLRGEAASEAAFKRLAPGHRVIHLATHAVALDDLCGGAAGADTRGVGGLAPLATDESRLGGSPQPAPARPADGRTEGPRLGRRIVLALSGANAADAATDENEGLLTAEEVATLDLRDTEWVVLSACESGVAGSWNREGSLGLTRAFRLAGARAVIASQWAVEDDATCEWMTALHRARAAGAAEAGDALQRASREVLRARRASGASVHPYYWAAFTATGD